MNQRERRLADGTVLHGLNISETDYLLKEIFEDRAYLHPDGLELDDDPIIVDVGANIGLFTLFALQEWPSATVHAFEPIPQIFEVLAKNTSGRDGVYLHNTAIGNYAGSRQITYYPRYTMMSGFDARADVDQDLVFHYIKNITADLTEDRRNAVLENTEELLEGRFVGELVDCRIDTMADFVKRAAITRIDLLKVDVEGAELDVLRGMDSSAWSCVRNAVVEISAPVGELDEAEELFARHGFDTKSVQLNDYRGTNLYLLYASR